MKMLIPNLARSEFSKVLTAALLLVVTGGILQDYVEAVLQHQGFYWSESILFKAFWLPFLITLSIIYIKRLCTWYWVPILTFFHLLSYALIIYLISASTLDHTFGFWDVLKRAVSEDAINTCSFTVLQSFFFVNGKPQITI